jgi:hypothetical protein
MSLNIINPANIFRPFVVAYPPYEYAKTIVCNAVGHGGPRCIVGGSDGGQSMSVALPETIRATFQQGALQRIYGRFNRDDNSPSREGTRIIAGDIESIHATIKFASVDAFGQETWSEGPWTDHEITTSSAWHDTLQGWYGDYVGVNMILELPDLQPEDSQSLCAVELSIKLYEADLPIVQRWQGAIAKRL